MQPARNNIINKIINSLLQSKLRIHNIKIYVIFRILLFNARIILVFHKLFVMRTEVAVKTVDKKLDG
jgi:hypothetical protein